MLCALIALFALGAVSTVGQTIHTIFGRPLPRISSLSFAVLAVGVLIATVVDIRHVVFPTSSLLRLPVWESG
jgi:hypothetical protein